MGTMFKLDGDDAATFEFITSKLLDFIDEKTHFRNLPHLLFNRTKLEASLQRDSVSGQSHSNKIR